MARTKREEPRRPPRLFYWLGVGLAVLLLLLVLLAPLVDAGEEQPQGVLQVVALFARDAPLRRTTIASAIGLAVTATVFFRGSPPPRPPDRPTRSPSVPPTRVVGA